MGHTHAVPVTARTTWLLTRVRPGEGPPGWGEFSDVPVHRATPYLTELRSLTAGLAAEEAADTLERIAGAWAARGRGAEERLYRRTALGGLATAVADAAARAAGLGLGTWLARRTGTPEPTASEVPLYANINRAMRRRTPETAAEVATQAVRDGFRTVKCAPFDGLSGPRRITTGLDIAWAVRQAIGAHRVLLLDCHHLLTDSQVLSYAREFTALRLGWLEDAARIEAPEQLKRVRDAVGAPLAGGEFAGTAREVLPALRSGALDILLPDVKHAGGPLQVLRLAALAAGHGARVSLHNPSGPIATAASAHVTALLDSRTPHKLPLEIMYGETGRRPSAVTPPEPVTRARYTLPGTPGIGLAPAPEVLHDQP